MEHRSEFSKKIGEESSNYNQLESAGQLMYTLIGELYPICRSITGRGFRTSLASLKHYIPLEIHEVPSGTKVFDWTVPNEWNISDAFVKNEEGEKIIDFARSNLHVLNYSIPINRKMSLEELEPHLFSLPDQPDVIPYRTSYYKENWGFCLSHNTLAALKDGIYEVVIDSSLSPGSLTYGEYFLAGEIEDEILISTHCCHPSLCNDNLSGMAVSTFLAKELTGMKRRYSYRFLFIPGAIGSITWLARNEDKVHRIKHGLVVACVGDPGPMTYKKSRRGNAEIDIAVEHVLKHSAKNYRITEFSPYGYDERQYCSPGFDLAVGSLTRSPHGTFPEYHTSADNLGFVIAEALEDSLAKYRLVIETLECNKRYINLNPKCEPQLGKRGLYTSVGGQKQSPENELAILWTLNLSDGSHSLLDIAERASLPILTISNAVLHLERHGLLRIAE